MILIEISLKGKRICVQLDPRHPYYERVYLVVRGLLSSYEVDENTWTISYYDMAMLRHRLDMLGLVEGRTIHEDAFQWITWIHSQRVRNEEIKKGVNNQFVSGLLDGKLKTVPYEDQLSAISFAYNNRRVGIFDEMGVGKSLEALATVVALGPKVRRSLLICPYTVQIGFLKEIKKHTHLKPLAVPNGRKRALSFIQGNKDTEWDVLLIHPENLIGGGKQWGGQILKLLRDMQWDMIIVDEFHMYKNPDAKRTKCVLSLLNDSRDREGNRPRAILMTGTPVSESPLNAFVVLRSLSLDTVPHQNKFENHFVVKKNVTYGHRGTHRKVVGFKNLDELKGLLEAVSIRRTKDDMTGFPDRVFMVRDVEMSGKQLALYKTICGEIVADLPRDSMVNLYRFLSDNSTVLRLRQVMNHPSLLDEEGESAKYVECDSVLEEVLSDPEAKVVLWTEYRKGVELLYERYNSTYGAVKIYGGVGNDELAVIADQFENAASPRVAVCIPAKAGTGVDFLARGRTSIYIDRPYSFTLYKQSLDRIHRRVAASAPTRLDMIRAKPATVVFLDVVASVDELIRDKLLGKQDMADAITTSNEKLVEMGREDLLRYLSL